MQGKELTLGWLRHWVPGRPPDLHYSVSPSRYSVTSSGHQDLLRRPGHAHSWCKHRGYHLRRGKAELLHGKDEDFAPVQIHYTTHHRDGTEIHMLNRWVCVFPFFLHWQILTKMCWCYWGKKPHPCQRLEQLGWEGSKHWHCGWYTKYHAGILRVVYPWTPHNVPFRKESGFPLTQHKGEVQGG